MSRKKNRKNKKYHAPEKVVQKEFHIVVGAFGDLENCIGVVEDKIYPEEGGVLTKFIGCSYLFKGYPNVRLVELLDTPKDLFSKIPELIGNMSFLVKATFLMSFVFLRIIAKDFLMKVCETYVDISHRTIHPYLLPEKDYVTSVKEIYRALGVAIAKVKNERLRNILYKIRDIFCMALNFDTAYKFRVQDILPKIDIVKLLDNLNKEIKRVCDIFIKRENAEGMKIRWKKLVRMLILFLMVSPTAKRLLMDFFLEVDLSKIKLDEADWYYCLKRHQYNFKGFSLEERLKFKEEIDKRKGHKIPIVRVKKEGEDEKEKGTN